MRSNAIIAAASVLVLAVFTFWQISYPQSMRWWAQEDGPFEYATALCYAACSVIFVRMAWARRFPRNAISWLGRAVLLLGALVAFVIMGEEISWGQRIIGFETPQGWAGLNYQQETTLHNLDWVNRWLTSSTTGVLGANAFNFTMMGFGFALPLVALVPWVRRRTARLAIPVMPIGYCVTFLGAWLYGKYLQGYAVVSNDPPEVREFLFAVAILLFAVTGLKRPWELYRVRPEDMRGHDPLGAATSAG